jgi:hypothetical protein
MNATTPVLPPGYSAVPPRHVAAVVTSLQMFGRPPERPAQPFPAGVTLEPLERTIEAYRKLYRAVGTDWLWFSRLVMADEKLQAILDNPQVEFFALRQDGRELQDRLCPRRCCVAASVKHRAARWRLADTHQNLALRALPS